MKVKTVAIVSLSSGVLGESFVSHELELGLERLRALGLEVRLMPHALMGMEYTKLHPEKRAEDLLAAFSDPDIDMILCAIGGYDTYRLAPYLFENGELERAARPKIFLGFSDTTLNHFMLRRAGLPTFYGQAFLPDVCELDRDMLPYTRRYFEELVTTGTISEVRPSPVWYESRTDFSPASLGKPLKPHPHAGFELLCGAPRFRGKILGGCIDSIFDMFDPGRYADMPGLCRKYGLFPTPEDWHGRILLLESSEEQMPPEKYEKTLTFLKNAGVFGAVSGVLAGKPMDGVFEAEYKRLLRETLEPFGLPVVFGINVGHALPRCIIPFGVDAEVDANEQVIRFANQ